jgi:hypothetical protein
MKKSELRAAFQQARQFSPVKVNEWGFEAYLIRGRLSVAFAYTLVRPNGLRHGLGRGLDSAVNFADGIIRKAQ